MPLISRLFAAAGEAVAVVAREGRGTTTTAGPIVGEGMTLSTPAPTTVTRIHMATTEVAETIEDTAAATIRINSLILHGLSSSRNNSNSMEDTTMAQLGSLKIMVLMEHIVVGPRPEAGLPIIIRMDNKDRDRADITIMVFTVLRLQAPTALRPHHHQQHTVGTVGTAAKVKVKAGILATMDLDTTTELVAGTTITAEGEDEDGERRSDHASDGRSVVLHSNCICTFIKWGEEDKAIQRDYKMWIVEF